MAKFDANNKFSAKRPKSLKILIRLSQIESFMGSKQ